jgi:RNA 2',3'-cyclic 3'-phosphodiesterase
MEPLGYSFEVPMARLFFAVGVSPGVVSALELFGAEVKNSRIAGWLRFVDANQAHYTLRFLGEVSPSRRLDAVRAGRAAADGATPFDVSLEGLGVFPDERRPHTLWIGAGVGAPELSALASRLERELAEVGFAKETRPFVPHLTLARVKDGPPSSAVRALLTEPRGTLAALHVERFMLMESRPGASGVRYVCLETFSLEDTCTPSKSPSTAVPRS